MKSLSIVCPALGALLLALPARAQPLCPNLPVVLVSDPQPPADVCLPARVEFPLQFFDDFSWRSFVALVWPAQNGQRGMPDTAKSVGAPGARVFETYKALAEVFHNDGSAPSDWNQFDGPAWNPCNVAAGFGDMVLASLSSNPGQAPFGSLVGPLVAQNQTYIRFQTGFNRSEFNAIQGDKWYLKANIPETGVTFPSGSIDVKSAWIDMTNKNPQRFYTRMAWLLDPQTGICSQKLVGLVGLHIVHKTPSRPQWIWSTFEQVDNVQEAGAQNPFNFNDDGSVPMPSANPYKLNPLPLPTPTPFNVTRLQQVSPITQATNKSYQTALAGTPWQFYKLVMTQWPVCKPPCDPAMRGTPIHTFPGTGANTPFSNTTMETFDQKSIFTGCMACHNSTQTVSGVKNGTDFLWSLRNHAFPPDVPNMLLNDPALKNLQSLLKKSKISKGAARSAATRNKAAVDNPK
jgi:hypothetical protein